MCCIFNSKFRDISWRMLSWLVYRDLHHRVDRWCSDVREVSGWRGVLPGCGWQTCAHLTLLWLRWLACQHRKWSECECAALLLLLVRCQHCVAALPIHQYRNCYVKEVYKRFINSTRELAYNVWCKDRMKWTINKARNKRLSVYTV